MVVEKSAGTELIEGLEKWIAGYMFLTDPSIALVVALWAVGSWVFDRFYTWPYLAITAQVKGAGKTQMLEILARVCRNAELGSGSSPAYILRKLDALGGHMTLLMDEAESTSSERKGFMSEVLNSGYRKGQAIGKTVGGKPVTFPSYCPKAFALIGDTAGTVRDRSIVITLERGRPERDFLPEQADTEAQDFKAAMRSVFGASNVPPTAERPDWLQTRDREIWGSMFGLAKWLKLDEKQTERLVKFAADNAGAKTAPKRRALQVESEDAAVDAAFAERALLDLRAILKAGEDVVFTAVAVKRLHELPTGPWRTFKGVGLDAISLANLIARFGIQPKVIKRHGQYARGYRKEGLDGAIKGLGR